MMDLETAIKHCYEVAEKKEREKQKWEKWLETDSDYRAVTEKVSCELCAEEHRQLAEWLKELVKYRQAFGCIEQRAAGVVIYKGQVFKTFDDDLVLKTQDKNGMCSFYGFREVEI